MNLRRNVLLAPLLCVKKILLAHHPPSILHTSQQRSNGSSTIDLALQQVQRAGKHSWIQENSEREFQRKFFLLIPLSTGKIRGGWWAGWASKIFFTRKRGASSTFRLRFALLSRLKAKRAISLFYFLPFKSPVPISRRTSSRSHFGSAVAYAPSVSHHPSKLTKTSRV